MSAIQPPRAPRPNCGRPSIQPCARREDQRVRQRHEEEPRQHQRGGRRHPRIARAAQAEARAAVQSVEDLVRRGGPQQHQAQRDDVAASAPPLLTNSGSTHGPTTSSMTATNAMSAAHSAITRLPSRLAQSRLPAPMDWPTSVVPRERDADGRHVSHRGQRHHDLRGGGADWRWSARSSSATAPVRARPRRTSRRSASRP